MESDTKERSTATEPELEAMTLDHADDAFVIYHPENLEAWLWSSASVEPRP